MRFHPGYGIAAGVVFAIEVLIALFVRDSFIRPYLGDVLAVLLVYLALRAATPLSVVAAIASTLIIAATIELGQLLGVLDILGLRGNRLAHVVLGGTFDTRDLVCYAVGAVIIVVVEAGRRSFSSVKPR